MGEMNESIQIPPYSSLDPDQIEAILDIDLDELMVLYYGRHRPHAVHPINPVLSVLEDPETGEVVGITFSRFAKQVLVEHPHMIVAAMSATVLAGDEMFAPGEFIQDGIRKQLSNHVRLSILDAWERSSRRQPASLIGAAVSEALLQYA